MANMGLNKDQLKAAKYISNWWQCNTSYLVLEGAGGCGKTYLVNHILKILPNCDPLLLTPTHESLKQLREKLDNAEDYEIRTIHSALGITPTSSAKELEFKQGKIPALWEDFNLAIIDEASMIGEDILKVLISIGIKIIWLGHSSQHPPVVKKRKLNDRCISPVFKQGWEIITLIQPMRNTGDLWDFNNYVESMIYDHSLKLPTTYDVKKKQLTDYLKSEEGKEDLLKGNTKVVMWTNAGVDSYNQYLREILYGVKEAIEHKYIKGDQIVLTSPYTVIDYLDRYKESGLIALIADKEVQSLYSNSKAIVENYKIVTVKLNSDLVIPCYKIKVLLEGDFHWVYEVIDKEDLQYIADYYEQIAWSRKTVPAKQKAYRQRHFILSCFAQVKHYFAATSYRLQGASIPNIIVRYNDILKNPNKWDRAKCLYVSTSRVQTILMIYRGA